MRWFLLLLVGILLVGCSTAAPTYTTAPTVDVAATVDAAVEATRVVERAVEATVDARVEATKAAPTHTPVPTPTPVVMTVFVPTPKPYVSAPGSIEHGIDELYSCLTENEEFRALYSASMGQAGFSSDSTVSLADPFLGDKDLFVEAMLQVAEEDSEYASMLSLVGGMAGEFCEVMDPVLAGDSGINSAEAEVVLGGLYDCLHENEEFLDFLLNSQEDEDTRALLSLFLSSDRELFIGLLLAGAREDPEVAEGLLQIEALVAAACP